MEDQGFDVTPDADQSGEKGNLIYAFGIAFVAAVGGFLFGYDLYIISPAILFLEKEFGLGPAQVGFAMSSAVIGCLLGPVAAGWVSDKIGRKKSLIIAAALFMISAIGTALPRNMVDFYIFRFLGGIGIGLASVISPLYIAEISPAKNRGAMVTMNQLAITIGGMSSVIVCYNLSFGDHWRWMFGSEVFPILVFLIALIFVPETPRWLMGKNRADEAMDVLTKINGRENARTEADQIRYVLAEETGSMGELIQPGLRLALFIAVGLAFFQMWTGASTIQTYAPRIFRMAGFMAASEAIYQTLFLVIFNFIFTIIALLLIDKVGRRPLLLIGTLGIVATQFLMGMCFRQNWSGFVVVLVLLLNVAFYATSLAPLAWLVMSEIFPNRIRGRAMSIAAFVLWINMLITNQLFPMLTDYLENKYGTPAGAFWLFTGFGILCFFFSLFLVPETKGKSLEEIAKSWLPKRSA